MKKIILHVDSSPMRMDRMGMNIPNLIHEFFSTEPLPGESEIVMQSGRALERAKSAHVWASPLNRNADITLLKKPPVKALDIDWDEVEAFVEKGVNDIREEMGPAQFDQALRLLIQENKS